jgi:pyruvate-formate lyase-activating enzyme
LNQLPGHQIAESTQNRNQHPYVTAVVADESGTIFELEGYGAVGMDGPVTVPLTSENTIPMPYGGELMFLPDRHPLLINQASGQLEIVRENPYAPGEALFPVAVFNSPGYIITLTSAYQENENAGYLPLFSYGAVGWYHSGFRSAVICVDSERRQDLRRMPLDKVKKEATRLKREMPANRLRQHLENCALTYGCPAGKNFFLGRYEAPLPTSRRCNARCLGCLSLQQDLPIPCSQNRIAFTPTPDEISEIALAHIHRVRHSVVSFGQGCEGDPLLTAEVIIPAIQQIRARTSRGTINMNTNGSRPDVLKKLLDAGLDSLRVSMNSCQEKYYSAYFRPVDYRFEDVLSSIHIALLRDAFVAVNYLNCPGFTDTPDEVEALMAFMDQYPIHMIQWRNLNFDPNRYLKTMSGVRPNQKPIGIGEALQKVKKAYPQLRYGYFNPPKESWNK